MIAARFSISHHLLDLSCLQALVALVIENLERMKATGKRNYDYVALQATDNSIPFYESLGFVRVGCIVEDDKYEEKKAKLKSSESDKEPSQDSPTDTVTDKSEIVSSAVDVYVTKVPGETPADIAKALNVSVWDIIFLNHYVYKDIGTRSRLMKDTHLYVPCPDRAKADTTSQDDNAPQWYIASENDTPKMIAKRFKVSCAELVQGNRERLPELQGISRLREGTRIKVSHFHIDDDKHVPYCHWTFPDDSFESNEPSYMMVRKLDRCKGALAKSRPVEHSLSVPVQPYSAPNSDLFAMVTSSPAPSSEMTGKGSKKRSEHAGQPKRPKRPLSGYMIYCSEQREILQDEMGGKPASEVMKFISKMWRELPDAGKAKYQAMHEKEQKRYKKAMEKYQQELANFYAAHPELKTQDENNDAKAQSLFNKVVKLNADGVAQSGSEFDYYFVLTYIPDLKWCHLAPMVKVGTWGPDKPKAEGRPVWMLVDESEGKEVDISAAFCEPVRSRAMKRTVDADNEQWDIIDDVESSSSVASVPFAQTAGSQEVSRKLAPIFTNRAKDGITSNVKQDLSVRDSRSATKPLTGSVKPKRKLANAVRKGCKSVGEIEQPSSLIVAAAKESIGGNKSRNGGASLKENDRKRTRTRGRGRPPRQPHAATKPLTGSIEPKRRRTSSVAKGASSTKEEHLGTLVTSTTASIGSDTQDDDWRSASDTEDDDWKPNMRTVPASGRERPQRESQAAIQPLAGPIEPKTKRANPVARRQTSPAGRKRKIISYAEDDESCIGSDMEDDELDLDQLIAPAKGRGRPQRQCSAATKPLTGTIEPKRRRANSVAMGRASSTKRGEQLSSLGTSTKGSSGGDMYDNDREFDKPKSPATKRGRPPRQSVSATKARTGLKQPKKQTNSACRSREQSNVASGELRSTSDINQSNQLTEPGAVAPPSKTRSLPFRKLAPIFLVSSRRYEVDKTVQADATKAAPSKRRKLPTKDMKPAVEPALDGRRGGIISSSDFRTVAMTRSGR